MVVEELREEQAELTRIRQEGETIPVIQVRNLDFSYGKVQVLFDVSFDVNQGETLALLGTNGAGKSTLLRVISGLGVASRGVVRFNGRTVTYADPELRVKIGIVQLIGGGATFPPLSVEENLRMAGFRYARREQRTAHRPGRSRSSRCSRDRMRHAGAGSLGRAAADARAGDGARARTRSAHHRRAVARTRADRRAAGPRGRPHAEGRRA